MTTTSIAVRAAGGSSPSACSSCLHCKAPLTIPADVESGVCTDCHENIVMPAYKNVVSLTPDDPGRIMWHGRAVREAFIAGALHAKTNGQSAGTAD